MRAEAQFCAAGLIAVGIASLFAVPTLTQSRLTAAAMLCFALSVPALSTVVLASRYHSLAPSADEYDADIHPPPFEGPKWADAFGWMGWISAIMGIALLFFHYWWVCGAVFTIAALIGGLTYLCYGRYVDDMVMAASMQAPERERRQTSLPEPGKCKGDIRD